MERNYENETVILQLINGEYVLGRVEYKDENNIKILKPMQIIIDPTMGGVGMIPYAIPILGKEPTDWTFRIKDVMNIVTDFNVDFKKKFDEYFSGIISEPNASNIIVE